MLVAPTKARVTRKGKAAMAEETQFTIGAEANCSDGECGDVRRFIIDPATQTVTHLVIEPKRRREPGRLAPLHLIDTTAGDASPGHARRWRGRDRRHTGREEATGRRSGAVQHV